MTITKEEIELLNFVLFDETSSTQTMNFLHVTIPFLHSPPAPEDRLRPNQQPYFRPGHHGQYTTQDAGGRAQGVLNSPRRHPGWPNYLGVGPRGGLGKERENIH